jgi:hypothetical protein
LNESQGYKWQVKLHCLRIVDAENMIYETTDGPAQGLEARIPYVRLPPSMTTKTKSATAPPGQKLRSRAGYKASVGG